MRGHGAPRRDRRRSNPLAPCTGPNVFTARSLGFPMQLSGDDAITEADLVFREQADGRKVSRLPNGKIVLIDLQELDRVKDGERWRVSLAQKDTFAIAHVIERLEANAAASFVPP